MNGITMGTLQYLIQKCLEVRHAQDFVCKKHKIPPLDKILTVSLPDEYQIDMELLRHL